MPYFLILKNVKNMITEVLPVSLDFHKKTCLAVLTLMRYSEVDQGLVSTLVALAALVEVFLMAFSSVDVKGLQGEKTSEYRLSYLFTRSLLVETKRSVLVILEVVLLVKEQVLLPGLNHVCARAAMVQGT